MHYEIAVCMPLLLAREKLFFSRREKNNAERDGVRGLPRQDEPDREKLAPNGLASLGTTCASMCVTRAILLFVYFCILWLPC